MNKQSTLTIVLLAGIVLVGALIFLRNQPLEKVAPPTPPTPSPTETPVSPPSEVPPTAKAPTESERQALLNHTKTTPEGEEAYYKLVQSFAVKTNVLDVTDCKVNPFVAGVTYKQNLTLKNTGEKGVSINFFDGSKVYEAPPLTTRTITVDFGTKEGGGIFGYYCGDGKGLRGDGLFFMIPSGK